MSTLEGTIGSIVVVVPAHNEAALLPRCLGAIGRAAEAVPVGVAPIVVLDSCTDGSRDVVGATEVVVVGHRNVGAARAAGFAASGRIGRSDVWFATTDADSEVPPDWLAAQLESSVDHDFFAGTIRVDWSDHGPSTRQRHDSAYRRSPHRHIHGASLGMRADLYGRVGGFRPLALAEDVDLVHRMRDAGARIDWNDACPVLTSDRRDSRAGGGFGDHLLNLERRTTAAVRQAS